MCSLIKSKAGILWVPALTLILNDLSFYDISKILSFTFLF